MFGYNRDYHDCFISVYTICITTRRSYDKTVRRKNYFLKFKLFWFSFPASLPTMDGEALLVNDFLAHSERIYVGEGPESIEPLNGILD
jgi:hypothetical protein